MDAAELSIGLKGLGCEFTAMDGIVAVCCDEPWPDVAGNENRTLMGDGTADRRLLRPARVCLLLPPIAGERDDEMG